TFLILFSFFFFFQYYLFFRFFFFFQAEDGIRDATVTGVQTCALPIYRLDVLERARDGVEEGRKRRAVRGVGERIPGSARGRALAFIARLVVREVLQRLCQNLGHAAARAVGHVPIAVLADLPARPIAGARALLDLVCDVDRRRRSRGREPAGRGQHQEKRHANRHSNPPNGQDV